MTAQIGDIYKYQSKEYDMVALSMPLPFHPKNYGLEPHASCTACYRGYWCEYEISDELALKDLYLFNIDGNYPPLNGVDISPPEFVECKTYAGSGKGWVNAMRPAYLGHRVYKDVHLPINHTGRVLLGRKSVPTYHIHGVWDTPWQYTDLQEFVFEDGILMDIIDQSETARDIRKVIRTMARSEPESRGTMGTYVRFNLPLLGHLSSYPWWIKRY